jgi:steroid delta-isomerase-like uncharacterized protein
MATSHAISANKALAHRWFEEVWNQGKIETIHELMSTDVIGHGLGEAGKIVRGPEAFIAFWKTLRAAFPDIRIDVQQTLEEADWIVARFDIFVTYTGEGLGFPANGKHARVAGMSMIRIAHGKLVEGFNMWDQRGMLAQIGGPDAQDSMQLVR